MRWVCAVVVLVACGAPPAPPAHMPASSRSRLLDSPIPGFERTTLQGESIDSASAGKVMVVKFFAKYCVPCQYTLPEAQKLHKKYKDVLVVGVSEDESADDALQQMRRYGLTFPVVHDRGRVLAGRFRVTEMPITFVADAAGTIVWVGGAEKKPGELRQAVEAVTRAAQ